MKSHADSRTYSRKQFTSVIKKVDSRYELVSSHKLVGGSSADVFALEVEGESGRRNQLVFRLHGDLDFLRNKNVAKEEFALLDLLHRAGLPVPKPFFVDLSCTIFCRPYLVMEYVDGTINIDPNNLSNAVKQLAENLARLHSVDLQGHDISFLLDCNQHIARFIENRPRVLDNTLSEADIRAALEPAWPLPQHNTPTVLHGDFWPGNIIWKDGSVAGILDWEDALRGDPLTDLSIARLELCWAYGLDIMNEFTEHYTSNVALDTTNLPYWDLAAALRAAHSLPLWDKTESQDSNMRKGHREFVQHVLGGMS